MQDIIKNLEQRIADITTLPFRILLIDDQEMIFVALKKLIKNAPQIEIQFCQAGKQAMSMALEYKPAVILQDLNMPDADGIQLVRDFRAHPETQHIPIVVLSATETSAIKAEAFTAGANDYVVKLPEEAEMVARLIYHAKTYSKHLELQMALEEVRHLSQFDELTQLANRRYFDETLAREFKRAWREKTPISLAMIDIDHFKQYNDQFGHPMGDQSLHLIAQALATTLKRPTDFIARYGGEEFAVILPHTHLAGAKIILEQMRLEVLQLAIPHEGNNACPVASVSIGVASIIPNVTHSAESLLRLADQALYRAKDAGRNQLSD